MNTLPGLSGRERDEVLLLLARARAEEGCRDATTESLIEPGARLGGMIVAKQACRVAGLPAVDLVCRDFGVDMIPLAAEASDARGGDGIARLEGAAGDILACERVALNFLSRISGVATITRRYAEGFSPTRVYDTRKTTPGWRYMEKYAVRAGGGCNHRFGLDDQILIKDNHFAALRAAGAEDSPAAAIRRACAYRDRIAADRPGDAPLRIEVEIQADDVGAFEEAVAAGADIVMLDNWTTPAIRRALARLEASGTRRAVEIELSGGITLERAAELKDLRADRVSVGSLTHSAPAVDFSLDIVAL